MPLDSSTLTLPASPLDELCINTIRFLAVDAVQQANSGHPGMPLGDAAMAFTLWDRFLKFNPRDPQWPNRDRFVPLGRTRLHAALRHALSVRF